MVHRTSAAPLDPETRRDLLTLVLGEHLGSGVDRHTYVLAINDAFVVKVQHGEGDFQNIAEWELWRTASDGLKKYLAPCLQISRGGRALVQRRCEPCPTHMLPTSLPKVLGDLHADNIGLLEGRPVVMDYGRHLALAMTANAKAMKKVYYDAA